MTKTAKIATLAAVMKLAPHAAMALPTVVTVSARKAGMSEFGLIAEALRNEPLRNYLAEIYHTVQEAA